MRRSSGASADRIGYRPVDQASDAAPSGADVISKMGRYGGTGRRRRLKISRTSGHLGSTPSTGTITGISRLPVLLLLAAATLGACAHPRSVSLVPAIAGSCRSESARWYIPEDAGDRRRLDAWCAGVGPVVEWAPAAIGPRAAEAPIHLRDVTFVSWNVHVGQADVERFVADLRAGHLTPERNVGPLVLLLQEAVRLDGVPPLSPGASAAGRIAPHENLPVDVGALARALQMYLFYVPSMRNGHSRSDPPADRGNAILSTLPLADAEAIELPFGRQRRVALLATVLLAGGGRASVGVVHLDALGPPRHLWIFGTEGTRARQARALRQRLPEGTLVLGTDLNTWLGEQEPAARLLRSIATGTRLPVTAPGSRRRVLDYLFFRAPAATAEWVRVDAKYGSDHHPLVGWIN